MVRIPSPDDVVGYFARNVEEGKEYGALGGVFGVNSNSAAQAVAERAAGRILETPGRGRFSPGADGSSVNVGFRN